MSKVFKRPMFRKGGSVNEGIMTGIVDREQYQTGTPDPFIGETDQFSFTPYMEKPTASSPRMDLPDLKSMTKENIDLLLEAAGDRGGYDPLTQFLLQYGPAAAKQTGGGTFANLIAAAEKPVASMIASKQKEDDFLRSIRTQATGAAMKQRSELEASERDRLFKKELADKQAELNRELSQADILAAKERADAKYLQDLELQQKKSQADYETRSKLLKEADLLEQKTTTEKIQEYTPGFAEEYDNDFTKGNRRATFEFQIRQQIAENFGESKVGGHIDVDVNDEKRINKVMKSKIKAGGAQKIYYNVNDGKAYLLTEQGLQPIDLAGGAEQITEVTETTPGGTETIKETSKIEDIFSGAGETELDKKIKQRIEENRKKILEGESQIKGPFR
jgi:hypothetical protein